jgi:hypothetical protein
VGAGTLWPFPVEIHRLLSDYFARWREIGLGTTGAPSPALPLFWLVAIASFANAAIAQKLLVGLLLALGLFGINRFVKRRTTNVAARIVAVGVYALAPVMRLTMVTGDLGALALYAATPYLLEMALRMLGPAPGAALPGTPGGGVRPAVPASSDALSRQAMRLALLSAVVVALAPSALVAIVVLWLVAGFRALRERPSSAGAPRRLAWLLGSSAIAALLLIPWSLEALQPHGAILGPLFAGPGGGNALRPLWSPVTFAHALLLAPGVSAFAGLAAVAIVGGALLVVSTSRRREVRLLASVIVVFGLWAGLVAKGWLPAPVVSPALWFVPPLVALAACAGYLVAGLAQDLPRHAAGLRHTVGAGTAILSAAAVLGGWVPMLASWSAPPASAVTGTGPEAAALAAVQGSATSDNQFRVLWLGKRFVDALRPGLRPDRTVPYLVTGPDGLSLLDTAPPGGGPGGAWLSKTVDALVGGRTHLAGHLLATAGIGFVVVDHTDASTMQAVILQQDLALEQQLAQADIYANLETLPIAALAPPPLEPAAASGSSDPEAVLRTQWPPLPVGTGLDRTSLGSFSGRVPAAASPRTVVLGEVYSPGWQATVGVQGLRHAPVFGWANGFTVPAGVAGTLRIGYSGEWVRIVWVIVGGVLVALGLVMAFSARMPKAESQAPPPLLPPRVERPYARPPSSRVRVIARAPRAPAPDGPRQEPG